MVTLEGIVVHLEWNIFFIAFYWPISLETVELAADWRLRVGVCLYNMIPPSQSFMVGLFRESLII